MSVVIILTLAFLSLPATAAPPTQVMALGRERYGIQASESRLLRREGKNWRTILSRPLCGMVDLAALPEGELFVACEKEKSILIVTIAGQIKRIIKDDQDGEDLRPPHSIALGPDGSLFFTATGLPKTDSLPRGDLYWIPPGSQNAWLISSALSEPQGVLVSRDLQSVFIAERGARRLMQYSLHGSPRSFNRRIRKPRILFDAEKEGYAVAGGAPAAGGAMTSGGGSNDAPGPAAVAWAGDHSVWLGFAGDSRVMEISVETGKIARTLTAKSSSVVRLGLDRLNRKLLVSGNAGTEELSLELRP